MNKRKVVLVSGTASGIGLAVAMRYIAEGYLVCGIDRVKSNSDSRIDEYVCDITNEDEVKNVLIKIETKYSELSYIINCAGIFFDDKRNYIEDISISEWQKVLLTNITGPMLVTKYAAPLIIKANGDKAIVNITSDQVLYPRKRNSAYATSKGGLESFSKSCAVELLEYGVRVNSVLPASVRTNFIRKMVANDGEMNEIYKNEDKKMPLGIIEPDDVAEMVFFLGSEKSRKITGQSILMDSGLYI